MSFIEAESHKIFMDSGTERALLSAIVTIPDSIVEIESLLSDTDFVVSFNKNIFIVLKQLFLNEGVSVFNITVLISRIEYLGMLKGCGGLEYIESLFNTPILKSSIPSFVSTILENSSKKSLYDCLSLFKEEVASNAVGVSVKTASELVCGVERGITDVLMKSTKTDPAENIGSTIIEFVDELKSRKGAVLGLPTGFNYLDKRINGLVPGTLSVLVARPKTGKCLCGSTPVVIPETGEIKRLDEVTSNTILSFQSGEIKSQKMIGPVFSGIKPVYKVVTRTGREILATDNHPFLSVSGWVDIMSGFIKKGARIAVPSKIPVFGKEVFDKSLLGLFAYWLSEGTVSIPEVTIGRKSVVEDVKKLCYDSGFIIKKTARKIGFRVVNSPEFEEHIRLSLLLKEKIKLWCYVNSSGIEDLSKLSGVNCSSLYNIISNKSKTFSLENIKKLQRTCPDTFNWSSDIIKYIGPTGFKNKFVIQMAEAGIDINSLSYDKDIPDFIFKLNKSCIAFFINRLFSGDGWVTDKEIGYASSSKKLITKLQHLLLRFGIVSAVRKRAGKYKTANGTYKNTRLSYVLAIYRKKYREKFIFEIGCAGRPEEVARVSSLLKNMSDGSVFGDPPKDIWGTISSLAKNNGLSLKDISNKLGCRIRTDRGISRCMLRSISLLLNSPTLDKLASEDIFWDQVSSVSLIGDSPTYDIQIVGGSPNFIAADIIVHNSTLLLEWAKHICFELDDPVPVLYIDTEMSSSEVKTRLLSNISGIKERSISNGLFATNDEHIERVYKAAEIINAGLFFHKYVPGVSVEQVISLAKKYHATEGIGAVFFDYIKLTDTSMLKHAQEHQLLGHIASSLKDLAGRLNIPVITAAQVGRSGANTGYLRADMVADSDRLLRYCNTLMGLSRKASDEIDKVKDGSGDVSSYLRMEGSHRLQILDARSGGSFFEGINVVSQLELLRMSEADIQLSIINDNLQNDRI